MNRHQLTYIDLHPEPVQNREPSTLLIWVGAAALLAAVYIVTAVLFSL